MAWKWAIGGVCAALLPSACGPLIGLKDRYLVDAGGGDSGGSDTKIRADSDAEADPDVSPDSDTTAGPGDATSDSAGDNQVAAVTETSVPDRIDSRTPSTVAPTNLRLWLSADKGIQCVSGRVTRWADQSSRQNDATLQHQQLGPQCQLQSAPHLVNGVDIPYFSAPQSSSNPNIVDETLDVDLSFLAGTSYTILTVARRWADPSGSRNPEYILGTSVSSEYESGQTCSTAPQHDVDLSLGYVVYNSRLMLTLDHGCDAVNASTSPTLSAPGPLTQTTALFETSFGRTLRINGAFVAVSSLNTQTLTTASGGAIGRAVYQTTATGVDVRFDGDIAEVIVYDAALTDADRSSLEQYLAHHWAIGP